MKGQIECSANVTPLEAGEGGRLGIEAVQDWVLVLDTGCGGRRCGVAVMTESESGGRSIGLRFHRRTDKISR